MKTFLKKHKWMLIGLVVGAIGGFIYWKYVGCVTGDCPITSSPLYSSIWGALIGGLGLDLIASLFKKKEYKEEKE